MMPAPLERDAQTSLTEQLVALARERIDQRLWRTGARIPSIRTMAASHGVSRFTVVAAYERLADLGLVEARPGSGYFVRGEPPRASARKMRAIEPGAQGIDLHWLLRNMHGRADPARSPGFGFFPADWYPGDLLAAALRAIGRQPAASLLHMGTPEGYFPLREWLQAQLAALDIPAPPEQIVLTGGVTQALDLIARVLLQPGDTVFVEDPAWFLMFGRFAVGGARVIGVPRRFDGPDVDALERLAAEYKPRLFVLSPVCHNPTGSIVSPAVAQRVLAIARTYDFLLVEDDIYGDFTSMRAPRFAALDRLQRVIYCGGFSKVLAPNMRVGYAAAAPGLARRLVEQKMLCTMSTPEVGERAVLRVVSDPKYARHLESMRTRLDALRDKAVRAIERAGWRVPVPPASGAFVWADAGSDTLPMAAAATAQGILTAPGALFRPGQRASTFMRFNVATCTRPDMLRWMARAIAQYRRINA